MAASWTPSARQADRVDPLAEMSLFHRPLGVRASGVIDPHAVFLRAGRLVRTRDSGRRRNVYSSSYSSIPYPVEVGTEKTACLSKPWTTAVRSPHATLGQQLYAARHRAELSVEEAACAAGVSMNTVGAVEAQKPVKDEVTAAMQGCALHCHAAELWCTGRLWPKDEPRTVDERWPGWTA